MLMWKFIERMEGAAYRNIIINFPDKLFRVGASEATGTGIGRWYVIGNSGEFVFYTVGVLVYIQKK
jgi:hypothetical protein